MITKESSIITAVCYYLALLENQKKLLFIRNNSGALKTARGGFIKFGKAGSPDILIFLLNGETIHCEVKNEKGKLTQNQKNYKKQIENLGHRYIVIRSVEEIEQILAV